MRLDESGRAPSPPLHDLRDLGLDGIPVEELNLPLIHLLDAALDFGVPSRLDSRLGDAIEAGNQLGGNPGAVFARQLEGRIQQEMLMRFILAVLGATIYEENQIMRQRAQIGWRLPPLPSSVRTQQRDRPS